MTEEYTYEEHRFRFAAWAASRAVLRVKGLGSKEARCMLNKIGFYDLVKEGAKWLPTPQDFDEKHREWCEKICKNAKSCGVKQKISHGIAAKLINVFIKALMPSDIETCPDGIKAKWYAIHPPIDRKVLKNMKNKIDKNLIKDKNFWSSLPGTQEPSWKQFNAENYQDVIDLIRKDLHTRLKCSINDSVPLWKNERFWIL